MRIELERVRYMPEKLRLGVLYVSDEFGTAAHLCACGCGAKIRTPLGPTEWSVDETSDGPSLSPSVGNWQQGCQSHYFIERGEVVWAPKWTPEQIAAGRAGEQRRRRAYFDNLDQRRRIGMWRQVWRWVMRIWSR